MNIATLRNLFQKRDHYFDDSDARTFFASKIKLQALIGVDAALKRRKYELAVGDIYATDDDKIRYIFGDDCDLFVLKQQVFTYLENRYGYWWRLSDAEQTQVKYEGISKHLTKEHAIAFCKFIKNPFAHDFIVQFFANPQNVGRNNVVPGFGYSSQILLQCEAMTVDVLKTKFKLTDEDLLDKK